MKFLEAGKVVNTHGVHGEVKIQPWADSPSYLAGIKTFYMDGLPVKVRSARVHKNCVIAAFEGVDALEGAIRLKNKTISISRDDAPLEEGRHFVADLLGLSAMDSETGEKIGVLTEVLSLPSNDVYVISGQREILVPVADDFIEEVDIGAGHVKIRMREGL